MVAKDETGNRYGNLVVIEKAESKNCNGAKYAMWSCICDCGNTFTTYGSFLRAGKAKSCGCLKTRPRKDWSGVKQGKLTVIGRHLDKYTKSGAKTILWECQCDCGNIKILKGTALKSGSSSCGCDYDNKKHGHSQKENISGAYKSWHAMLQRCLNENHESYESYGGKGITVDDRWKDFINFLEDMGDRPEGTTLLRVNGSTIYSKDTCEWATYSIQAYDQKKRESNKSGKTGVCWNKALSKWEAYISVNSKKVNLGIYLNFEDAVKAREDAEITYYGWVKQ